MANSATSETTLTSSVIAASEPPSAVATLPASIRDVDAPDAVRPEESGRYCRAYAIWPKDAARRVEASIQRPTSKAFNGGGVWADQLSLSRWRCC